MSPTRVVFRKFDGSLHWNHAARLLGEDEYGVWVGVTAQTPTYKGTALHGPAEAPFVMLFPREAWWTALFNAVPHRTEVYCDITTVPEWTSDGVTMVDLDLDVRRRRTGEVQLLDVDEFAEHRVAFGYPSDTVAAAEASAAWLLAAVRGRTEPFGTAATRWMPQIM